jgi:hypothetical protein
VHQRTVFVRRVPKASDAAAPALATWPLRARRGCAGGTALVRAVRCGRGARARRRRYVGAVCSLNLVTLCARFAVILYCMHAALMILVTVSVNAVLTLCSRCAHAVAALTLCRRYVDVFTLWVETVLTLR